MTTEVDIVNRALQTIGTRTTVTSLDEVSNEAIQANLIFTATRDQLLRKAPWNCATNFINMTYITSVAGTPENPTMGTSQWQKGLPAPPWAYEYQYPADCLRPLWIVPQSITGFGTSGVPITTAITGGAPSFWGGPPIRFKVGIDQFFTIQTVTVVAGGSGYAVGDIITFSGTPAGQSPIGAPAQAVVTAIGGGGSVSTADVISSIYTTEAAEGVLGGSYFASPTLPLTQGSTTGSGTGATFNAVIIGPQDLRVILTNQEQAILSYIRRIFNPNVMDPSFQEAWVHLLGARLCFALTGGVAQANLQIQLCNNIIVEARQPDANEGLTINDITPDWIRQRGICYPTADYGGTMQFDWGPLFTPY